MSSENNILIVDDAPSVAALMKETLVNAGYDVKWVSDGETALETLKTIVPDIVLLDVVMPGIDGFEVCRRIRGMRRFGLVKIIMVSSESKLDERLKGYEAGADDYITKPFDKEELLAKIRVFLRLKSVENELLRLNRTLNQQVKIRTEQLIDAEKLAAIGRHAAGIVHNLNNPLQVIMGTAQILALRYSDDPELMAQRKAAAHMKRIITTILSTSYRESRKTVEKIDLNEVLKDQLELLKANAFFKHQIKTKTTFGNLPLFKGEYAHFSQSFGNLIKNAIDAMYPFGRGVLHLTTAYENGTIIVRISDTGHGIPKEKLEQIFHPFYSTKPLTASDQRPTGTGLGLASCKEMIESYGGEIQVESIVGHGAVFTVRLPLPNDETQ